MGWTNEEKTWIKSMNDLFNNLFGPDYCQYEYSDTKHCMLVPGQLPIILYNHDEWEKNYASVAEEEVKVDKVKEDKEVKVDESLSVTQYAYVSHSEDKESTGNGNSVQVSVFDLSMVKNFTRAEIAAVKLPEVVYIAEKDVVLAQMSELGTNDPTLAIQRPSEATVQYALSLLASATATSSSSVAVDSDDEGNEVAVRTGTLGTYTKKSLQVFKKMCNLSSEAARINEEKGWLSQACVLDVTKVKELLLNARPHDEVIRHGQFLMDVSDLSTLACERYINGFSIDVISLKLVEKSNSTSVIYLPSFSQMWAKQGVEYFKHKVIPFFESCPAEDASCILTPVHFESPLDWGLLCFDVKTKTVYFDDGLKIQPPSGTLSVVQNMLGGFKALSHNVIEQGDHWNNSGLRLPLPRINMPIQTQSGIGAGSCGVGVILAIRDIVASGNCLPSFKWTFGNMANLRKELMALILRWRSEEV